MKDCIFCKIVAGEIPSAKLYEDEEIVIFKDVSPIANIHLLCVPKDHFASLNDLNEKRVSMLGLTLAKIGRLQNRLGLENGYRLIVNQGKDAGQTVQHLHIHILGGETLPWG